MMIRVMNTNETESNKMMPLDPGAEHQCIIGEFETALNSLLQAPV